MVTRQQTGSLKWCLYAIVIHETDDTLSCFTEANKHLYWCRAKFNEYESLIHNGTKVLMPHDMATNLVGYKWVFFVRNIMWIGLFLFLKHGWLLKGSIGINFKETFSLAINPITIRLLLSITISHGWDITQLDLSNAFLNGTLDEKVWWPNLQYLLINPSCIISIFFRSLCMVFIKLYILGSLASRMSWLTSSFMHPK